MMPMRFTLKLTASTGETLIRDPEGRSPEELRSRVVAERNFPLELKPAGSTLRARRELSAESLVLWV